MIMRNNKQQPFVVPFYACNVHAPTLSVTRLAEQGFNIQRSEEATITHERGLDAQLKQKEGLGLLRAEMVHWPRDCKLTATHIEAGQIGLLAPMTPTPTGSAPQPQGNTADYW